VKHLRRRLFNGLAWLSLLLCLLIAVLWVRSHWIDDYLHWSGATGGRVMFDWRWIHSEQGSLYWVSSRTTYAGVNAAESPATSPQWAATPITPLMLSQHRSIWNELGFWDEVRQGGAASGSTPITDDRLIAIPDWALLLAGLQLPSLASLGFYRRRRQTLRKRRGQCLRCGHDLRATPVKSAVQPARGPYLAASPLDSRLQDLPIGVRYST